MSHIVDPGSAVRGRRPDTSAAGESLQKIDHLQPIFGDEAAKKAVNVLFGHLNGVL